MWACGLISGVALLLSSAASALAADPIQVLNTFHFRDVRGPNDAGLVVGERLSLGADVRPNPSTGDLGTTVTASQVHSLTGETVVVPVRYIESPALPDQYFTSIPYDPGLTGAWTITVENAGSANSPVAVLTQVVGDVAAMPKVENMSLSGSATTPTFNWTVPGGATPDTVAIYIFDLGDLTSFGTARLIHQRNLASSTTSYTVPAVLNGQGDSLEAGTRYSVAIQLDDRAAPTGGPLLSRTRSFFGFVPVNAGPIPVFLPTVDEGVVSPYQFTLTVVGGQVVFIDPLVAIGYDYAVGPGDPNFESVLLPSAGDDQFDLYLHDGTGWVFDRVLAAGQTHTFPVGGVDRFRILGIEAAAGLNPRNATAFITGLSFVASGRFTGTMTPLIHPPDHFLCYTTRPTRGGPAFTDVPGLEIEDQFETARFDVRKPVSLCTPASKNASVVFDPDTHLRGYKIELTKTKPPQPKHVPQHVRVKNQFGELLVDTQRPDRLLVPSAKSLSGPVDPPVPGSHRLDHYQCYPVHVSAGGPAFPKGLQAEVVDQFVQPKRVDVKKPTRLCVPSDKSGEGIKSAENHLMCYRIAPAKREPKHDPTLGVHVATQFGREQLDTIAEDELCLPSTRTAP